MPAYRLMAVLQSSTGLPEDVVTNSVHVVTNNLSDAETCAVALAQVYVDLKGALALTIDRNSASHQVRIYEVGAGPSGPPVLTVPIDLTGGAAPTSDNLPQEVSLCVSFRPSDYFPGWPQAAQRGRIYLGPWVEGTASHASAVSPSRPGDAFREDVMRAMATFFRDVLLIPDAAVVVLSRSTGEAFPVNFIWIDDEWDTQRRRQVDTTARLTWQVGDPIP